MTETIGYAALQIIPTAKGFKANLERETSGATESAGRSGGRSFRSGFMSSMRGLAGPLGASLGAAAVLGFGKASIDAAGDLSESVNKANVVFGESGAAIAKWSKDSKQNLLLTQQQAVDAASTFGIFGKQAGLTGPGLAQFSLGLTGLAQDLKSFYNPAGGTEQAINAIGAALRGESEPIRAFGVLLSDDAIKAEALSMGLLKSTKSVAKVASAKALLLKAQEKINKVDKDAKATDADRASALAARKRAEEALAKALLGTTGKLSMQQRVLAAQSLIFKQTSDAQGDAARTLGSYANQSTVLSKQFNDFKLALGGELLPMATEALTSLNTFLSSHSEEIKGFFEGVSTAVSVTVTGLGGIASFVADNARPVELFGATLLLAVGGLKLTNAIATTTNTIKGLTAAWRGVEAAATAAAGAEALAAGAGASGAAGFAAKFAKFAKFAKIFGVAGIGVGLWDAANKATDPKQLQNLANSRRAVADAAAGASLPKGALMNSPQYFNITVNNPKPEPAGKSVAKAVQRAAVLGHQGKD